MAAFVERRSFVAGRHVQPPTGVCLTRWEDIWDEKVDQNEDALAYLIGQQLQSINLRCPRKSRPPKRVNQETDFTTVTLFNNETIPQ